MRHASFIIVSAIALAAIASTSLDQHSGQPHRLVGVACGPDRITMSAVEEDMFPAPCDAIGRPEEFGCLAEDTPEQCVAYLGRDGW